MDGINDDVTIVIKTFNRPDCLKECYLSIRRFYPKMNIIIVDDGENSIDDSTFLNDSNVKYMKVNFDIGVSAGRNLGTSKVETKYTVLTDDDSVFWDGTNIEKFYELMESSDYDLIGGTVNKKLHFSGNFTFKNGGVFLNKVDINEPVKEMHITPIFFIANTDVMKKYLFYEPLKSNGEHSDFFITLYKNNIKVGMTRQVDIGHSPKNNQFYGKFRNRNYRAEALKHSGIKFLIDNNNTIVLPDGQKVNLKNNEALLKKHGIKIK